MFSTSQQALAFLYSLYAGLVCGVLYDALGLLRRLLSSGGILTAALDFLFWILCAALVSLAGALSQMEGFRLYLALGALCGGLLWKCGIGKIIFEACKWVRQAGKRAGRAETHCQR